MTRRHSTARQGFTLIELLVGLALIGIILTALSSYFMNTSRISLNTRDRADMQQEILNAQQLITGRLREAWYVYPPATPLTLNGASAVTTRNPFRSDSNWQTDRDPILAMILPPEKVGAKCESVATPPSTTPIHDGCYRFYAYYPVHRNTWVNGLSAASTNNPGPDPQNPDVWLLAEYRAAMTTPPSTAAFPPSPPPTPPQGLQGRLLADDIAPTNAPGATYRMFSYTVNPSGSDVTGVTIRLASIHRQGRTTQRLPDATGTYTQEVAPTNLGKLSGP